MLKYGARRRGYGSRWSTTRPDHVRGNAGRNRATKPSSGFIGQIPTRFAKTDNNLGRRDISRGMSKRARFAGRLDIEAQLIEFDRDHWSAGHGIQFTDPMWWVQEQELLEAKGKDNLRWMHLEMTNEEYTEWRAYQDVYNYEPSAHEYDFYYFDDDWYEDRDRYESRDYADDYGWDDGLNDGWDDDPKPQDAAWKDLWLNGTVDTPELYEFENGLDVVEDFDCDDWYGTKDEEHAFFEAITPIPDVHPTEDPAYWRAVERQHAGERFFRQHGRAVAL